ncbi:MAG: glycine cleavage system protein GcvH [Anaerolineae bacterium]
MGDLKTPAELKYTKTDEWIKVEGDEALVGITDYAQDALSDLVYAELPAVGDTFAAGEEFGAVESVKASAPLKMPVAGEIIAVNTELEETPEIINEDPYDKGWIVRIRITDASALANLMDAAAYAAYCEER